MHQPVTFCVVLTQLLLLLLHPTEMLIHVKCLLQVYVVPLVVPFVILRHPPLDFYLTAAAAIGMGTAGKGRCDRHAGK